MLESIMIKETPEYLARKVEDMATQQVMTTKNNPTSIDIEIIISKSFEILQLQELKDKEILILRLHARRALENKITKQKIMRTMKKYRAYENAQYYNSTKPLLLGMITTAVTGLNTGMDQLEVLILSTSCGPILGYIAAKMWEGITRRSSIIQYIVSVTTEDYKNIRMIKQDTKMSRQESIRQIQKIREEEQVEYQGVKISYKVARKIGWV